MKKKMAMFLALTLSLGCIGTACGSSKKADADTKKENTKTVTADEVSEEETLEVTLQWLVLPLRLEMA